MQMILAAAVVDNSAELWHCQMGHINWPGLKHLIKVVTGMSISSTSREKLSVCACCVIAKFKQAPLRSETY